MNSKNQENTRNFYIPLNSMFNIGPTSNRYQDIKVSMPENEFKINLVIGSYENLRAFRRCLSELRIEKIISEEECDQLSKNLFNMTEILSKYL